MCGISGIFSLTGQPVDRLDVATMNAALVHRGPDGEGIWMADDERCVLGHRRLAILDVDTRSDQPMLSVDGRYVLVLNGEIYNFLEIRTELASKGHQFRTESDTEVVIAAWREWGEAMLPRFNGMWALAIYDQERKELFMSRDRFGVKPLLYVEQEGRVAFASETRALLALPWCAADFDADIVRRTLFDPFTVEASERSIYRQVARLPAGHSLRLGPGGRRLTRWWRTSDHLVKAPSAMPAAAEEFYARFKDAVQVRMRSDVSIGSCLSGGFDSSAIVATMRHIAEDSVGLHDRENKDWRHAFIASFPGLSNDETPEAKIAASYAGIDEPTLIDVSQDGPTDHLEEVMDTMEDIFIGLPTAVWKTYRSVEANGVRVSIDGHGADEMMGGYRQGGQSLQFMLRNWFGNASGRHPGLARVNDYIKLRYLRRRNLYFLRGSLLPPPPLTIAANSDSLPSEWGVLNRRLYGMFHSTVLPTLMRNFDRLSMAHSVEVRSPFLDWRLVTYAFSLPDAMKSNAEYSKLIGREAMRGRMPEQIRAAKRKMGFGSQMPEWLNAGLGKWAAQQVAAPNATFDAIVDRKALLARIEELNRSRSWDWEIGGRLWPYVNLAWLVRRAGG